jgi:hypothetical protein
MKKSSLRTTETDFDRLAVTHHEEQETTGSSALGDAPARQHRSRNRETTTRFCCLPISPLPGAYLVKGRIVERADWNTYSSTSNGEVEQQHEEEDMFLDILSSRTTARHDDFGQEVEANNEIIVAAQLSEEAGSPSGSETSPLPIILEDISQASVVRVPTQPPTALLVLKDNSSPFNPPLDNMTYNKHYKNVKEKLFGGRRVEVDMTGPPEPYIRTRESFYPWNVP